MAQKTTKASAPTPPGNNPPSQTPKVIDLHMAVMLAPSDRVAEAISASFGLDPVDFKSVRDTTIESLTMIADSMQPHLNGVGLRVSLDRIVNAFVNAAYGAAKYYSEMVTKARDKTTKLANDYRDEDRDGVLGFDTDGQRAREYAAISGLKAYALVASATGAVEAFHNLTGETWKPYQKSQPHSRSVSRQSAAAELAAFGE